MTDHRLHRWLEAAEQPLAPDPRFTDSLRDELRAELGFIPSSAAPLSSGRPRVRIRSRRGPFRFLLVAALVAAGVVGTASIAGSLLERAIHPPTPLLSEILQTGRIRVAIRPDHPQFRVPGQPAAGFDADVAAAIAAHLGVRSETVLVDASAILSGAADDQWEMGLPSVALWQIDDAHFLLSSPYYRWPHRLVVAETSAATSLADLGNEPICAVGGDAGELWLRGRYGGVAATPITADVVTKTDDEECLSALSAGEVAAVVTAHLSDADVQVRSGLNVIGGPEPEPRGVIVQRGRFGAAGLMSAIEDALSVMRTDGSLTRLSQNRFGGADLSSQ